MCSCFLVERGSRSIATWTFFFEAKEESSSACVVCLSARGLLHWGETSGLYKYVGKGL